MCGVPGLYPYRSDDGPLRSASGRRRPVGVRGVVGERSASPAALGRRPPRVARCFRGRRNRPRRPGPRHRVAGAGGAVRCGGDLAPDTYGYVAGGLRGAPVPRCASPARAAVSAGSGRAGPGPPRSSAGGEPVPGPGRALLRPGATMGRLEASLNVSVRGHAVRGE